MTTEWFKRTTDVLADQLFALQLIRTHAAERGISVQELLDVDRTCDGTFLGLDELQLLRRQLVLKFDQCPVKFRWNALYCLCVIDVLVLEVFVDNVHPLGQAIVTDVMTSAANTRDLDELVAQKLLFEFFWRSDADLLTALKTAISSSCILCTQRSLPPGTVFTPIPCVQCRFDNAFTPETEIVHLRCTHLSSSLAPMSPDAVIDLPDLPSGPETSKASDRASHSSWFPCSDGAFEQIADTERLAEIMTSLRSSTAKILPAARSTEEASNRLMTSRVLRDYNEELAELTEARAAIEEVGNQRRETAACKTINEWMLLRLADVIEALARRLQRSERSLALPQVDHESYWSVCNRLQQNLKGMVLQDTELKQLTKAFNELVLDPLTRSRQRIFRPYIDSRKLFYAIGVAPADILAYDLFISQVTNKTVFELRPRHPCDRFFKAIFIAGLFRLYLTSIGCSSSCIPVLFRADDRYQGDGFCFAVDGWNVVAVMHGRCVARATDEGILSLCIEWIRLMLAGHFAGEATDSLRHLLEATTI